MTLYYEGSDGSIIDFMSHPIFAQSPETLTDNRWSYSTISGVNGLGRVKRFFKDTQEASLTLSIMTETAEEFNKVMYDIHRTFDRDIRQLKPGIDQIPTVWCQDNIVALISGDEAWENFFLQVYLVAKQPLIYYGHYHKA